MSTPETERRESELKNESVFTRIDNSLIEILKELKKNNSADTSEETNSMIKNTGDFKDITKHIYQRLDTLESDMSILQGSLMALEQSNLDIEKSIPNLKEMNINFEKRFKFNETIIDSLQKEVMNPKTNISKKQPNDLTEVVKRIDYIQKGLEPKTIELNNRLVQLEEKVKAINSTVTTNNQLSEIIDRLVFLESRLAAMESMIRKLSRYSPVIVE